MEFVAENLACVRGERVLFRQLGFVLAPGDALILRGANGTGKTSLLKILAGLLLPTEGRLLWAGEDTAEDPDSHRARIGYLGHLDALKPMLGLAENLRHWAAVLPHGDLQPDQAIAQAMAQFAITPLADLPVRYLSAGQRKRGALARLQAQGAKMWLLDEPTVSLDSDGVERLRGAVTAYRSAGGMVIAATHVDLEFTGAREIRIENPAFMAGVGT